MYIRRFTASLLTVAVVMSAIYTTAFAASSGWRQQDDTWVYILGDGTNATGWKKLSKKWYYFDSDGLMQKGLQSIDGKLYFFDKNGAMKTGWQQDSDKNWYYFRSGGEAVVSAWLKTGGVWYYFDAKGVMLTGINEIDGVLYNFKPSGALATGWHKDEDGSYYYFTSNGAAMGWRQIGSVWYFFNESDARMVTGLLRLGEDIYCFDESGAMLSGKWYQDEDSNWYYFTKSGAAYCDEDWHRIGKKLYYFDVFGVMTDEKDDPNTLSNSLFKDPYTKNNEDICAWAWNAYNNSWGYMYGTYGNILTKSKLDSMSKQHPNDVGKYKSIIEEQWLGGRTCDCIGLIKGYLWYNPNKEEVVYGYGGSLDAGANLTFEHAKVKGTLDTMPDIPGLGVYHKGHVGIYVGDGIVIHAANNYTGVTMTYLDESNFTHWFKITRVKYPD